MDKHQNEIDLFDQYTDGILNKDLSTSVEERLSSDREFAAGFEEYKLLTDGIKYSGRKKLLQKVKSWDKQIVEFPDQDHSGKSRFIRWYYFAAAISFFIIASAIIYSSFKTNYETIVANNYMPYTYIPETTRGDKIDANSMENIFTFYDQGEYVQTIQMINKLDAAERSELSDYILANAYQATGKFDEAIVIYGEIANMESIYSSGSKWYLALCYLSKKDLNKAVPLLENLQQSKTSYAPKAKSVLEELNK